MRSFLLFLVCVVSVLPTTLFAEDAEIPAKDKVEDLKLFSKEAEWTFKKNKAEGSFELSKDGEVSVGVLNYDFSKVGDEKAVAVVASTKVNVAEGATGLRIDARCAQAQPIAIRFIDGSGQTHQYKGKLKGGGGWETINVSFAKKFEAWGGAKDGKIHFPIQQIALVVAAPKEDPKTGKIEFANARTSAK